jgi:hypothetical protein
MQLTKDHYARVKKVLDAHYNIPSDDKDLQKETK